MRAYDPSELLISIHLPKCGGSSFKAALRRWYGKKLHFHYYDEEHKRAPSQLASYRIRLASKVFSGYCVHGHFNKYRGFGINEYYPHAKQFISFVRDPLEILISNYYFVNKKVMFRDGKRYRLQMDINEYLEKVIDEAQSWYMAFFPDRNEHMSIPDYIESKFIFIGVMEEYQKSLDILADILGKPRFMIPEYNVTERDPYTLDDQLLSRFRDAYALDYKIYDYAKKYVDSFTGK